MQGALGGGLFSTASGRYARDALTTVSTPQLPSSVCLLVRRRSPATAFEIYEGVAEHFEAHVLVMDGAPEHADLKIVGEVASYCTMENVQDGTLTSHRPPALSRLSPIRCKSSIY